MNHQVKKLTDRISLLYGVKDECCMYLLEGSEAALVIDTGYGSGDIRADFEEVTSLPYWVVNTHGHGDHSGGNIWFDEVYMSANALDDALDAINLNKTVLPAEQIAQIEKRMQEKTFTPSFVDDGFIFDLGDREVEVIEIPGHTKGCLAFLDKKDRVLFSGDCAVKSMDILMVVPQALTLSAYLSSMKKLKSRRDEFDYLCTGHDGELLPASFIDEIVDCCTGILDGTVKSEPITLPPVFGVTDAMRAVFGDFAVSYRKEKLR